MMVGIYILDLKEEKYTKLLINLQQCLISPSLPELDLPTREQMKNFYTNAQGIFTGHQFPITKYEGLKVK